MRSRCGWNFALGLLIGGCLLSSAGCQDDRVAPVSSDDSEAAPVASVPPAVVAPSPVKPSPKPAPADAYRRALDKADSAQNISQSAQSQDDWKLVVSRWQQAIGLLRSVPATSPNRKQAQTKLAEYQQRLAVAKQQAARSREIEANYDPRQPPALISGTAGRGNSSEVAVANGEQGGNPSAQPTVFQAPIKRRLGGTPVIDVLFNGQATFEMIVDTGASGTVVTRQMARSLSLPVVGTTKVDTASERDVEVQIAKVQSIAVGGAQVQNVAVAIGGAALDIGLLGHDFFGQYDVTVKQNVVEFRQR